MRLYRRVRKVILPLILMDSVYRTPTLGEGGLEMEKPNPESTEQSG